MSVPSTSDRPVEVDPQYPAVRFCVDHITELSQIFPILGFGRWPGIEQAVDITQATRIGEHGGFTPEFTATLTEEKMWLMLPHLSTMGMLNGNGLKNGHSDYYVVLGAIFPAMLKKCRKLVTELQRPRVTIGELRLEAGQRPRGQADGSLDDLKALMSDNVKAHWFVQWQLHMELSLTPDARKPFATEFELLILALLIAFDGKVRIDLDQDADRSLEPNGFTPARNGASYKLILPDRTTGIAINTPAVERPAGDPRPTAESSTLHVMKYYRPKPGSTYVIAPGTTHRYRMAHDIEQVIRRFDKTIRVIAVAEDLTFKEVITRLWKNALLEVFHLLYHARLENREFEARLTS